MKVLIIFLLALVFLLVWMLYLAEQDAARLYGIAKQAEAEWSGKDDADKGDY